MIAEDVFHVIKSGVVYQLEWDAEGKSYIVSVPELQGCLTVGDTIDEAMAMIAEALELYVETCRDMGADIPERYYRMFPAASPDASP